MAMILHCDGCHVQNDSLDGNAVIPGVEYMGAPVLTNCAPPRIKVWRDVNVYGKLHDLCNRCIKKINMVLQLPEMRRWTASWCPRPRKQSYRTSIQKSRGGAEKIISIFLAKVLTSVVLCRSDYDPRDPIIALV